MNTREKVQTSLTALAKRDSIWVNPLLWAGISVGSVLIVAAIMSGTGLLPESVGIFIVIFLSLIPALALIVIFAFYPAYEHVMKRLVLLYLAVIIIFGSLYFTTALFFRDEQTGKLPFEGIHDPWTVQIHGDDELNFDDAMETYFNSLHFSTVNITTSSYGDIHPTRWYTKALGDLQVLLGLGIIVIAVGKYFGEAGAKRDR